MHATPMDKRQNKTGFYFFNAAKNTEILGACQQLFCIHETAKMPN
jgi:hypothetical protein